MKRPPKIVAVLGLCLLVVGCESKCDSLPFLDSTKDIATDQTYGPMTAAVSEATPSVEKLAMISLLLAASGRMTADDASRAFDNDVRSIASGSVDAAKVTQVLDSTVDAYLAVVQAKVQAAPAWPASRSPDIWAAAAALQLAVARKEITAARAEGEIPRAAINHLSRVEGWTRGEEIPQSDPFAGYDDLVARGVEALSAGEHL